MNSRVGDAWVLVAAFNEGAVIGRVVLELLSHFENVVVVDDGSEDDTVAVAAAAGAHVVRHPVNLGQGAAIQTGLDYALSKNAKYLVTFDADGQHAIEDALTMLRRVRDDDLDVVIGSRFIGKSKGMPISRRLVLKAAVLFTRLTTGMKVTDAHNGLRVFSARGARKIRITHNRMAHASEIMEQIARRNMSVAEVPVTITYTEYSLRKGQKVSNSLNILLDLIGGRLHK